jgi:hypothetical protein
MIDIKNQKFGKLTVIEFYDLTKSRHALWKCQCECGNSTTAESRYLKDGSRTSCGCNNRQRGKRNRRWKGYEDISLSYFNKIKSDSVKRGLTFDVTIEFLWELFLKQNKKCALSGEDITFGSGTKGVNDRTTSLDRIDSSFGYTENNVQWVTKNVNTMKWDLSQERFFELVKKIYHKNPHVM